MNYKEGVFTQPSSDSMFFLNFENSHELKYANSSITKAPNNCHCVKGLGKTEPDMNELYVKDGVVVPYGKPAKSRTTDSSLLYNEYVKIIEYSELCYYQNINILMKQQIKFTKLIFFTKLIYI